jgi:TRAP-type C4-dicarboxylate transport system permease small subunit
MAKPILPRLYDRLIDLTGWFAGICIALIAIGVTADVALRYFRIGSLPWVPELSEYSLFIFTFAGAPWVLREAGHVRVDVLVAAVPPRVAFLMEIVADLLGLAASAALMWFGYLAFAEAYASETMIYKTLTMAWWWFLALIPMSAMLLCVEFVRRLVRAERDGPAAYHERRLGGM